MKFSFLLRFIGMKIFNLIPVVTMLIFSCNDSRDMKEIFFKNETIFKKIENPIKTDEKYFLTESTITTKHSVFDSTYLMDIREIFEKTSCNNIRIMDGDVFVRHKGSLDGLYFTDKTLDGTIELLNFRGTLEYLLNNGKRLEPPFAIKIAPNWYVVRDVQLL